MNYGKKKASQRQKKITSKSTMQGKRVGVRLFKAFLLCLLFVGIAGVVGGGVFVKKILDNTPEVSPADVKPSGYTTFVYADDGKTEIQRFVASGSNRVYKTLDEIPEDLQHAFIAIEDERFYDHNGIDLQGIARAAMVGLTSGNFSEGASTLTQQLIKNNVFPEFTEEKTFYDRLQRKLQEQFLALEIEKQMSKEEILEAYLNTINLGQNSLGVQSAAQRYFAKDVSELTLSESAVIAGITQSPSGYNPVTNPEANAKRRQKVLDNMLDQGYIDQAAYDEALEDDVYARIQQVNTKVEESESSTSYFVDALADQVMQDLQDQLGYSETQAYNALYSGGLTIYSTQNMEMQKILIIEDDRDIATIERDYLELNDYQVEIAADGLAGLERGLHGAFDLILLDLMLPGMDGFSVCRRLREETNIPILMVTARREDIDKIRGLGLGADDYIEKPFSPSVLVARVRAHLARYERLTGGQQRAKPELQVGGVRLNTETRRVFVDGREVELKNKEYALLHFLMLHLDMVFSREELYEKIWGMEAMGDNATVAVHINRIREKIEQDPGHPRYIQTVWGAGYRFRGQ